MRRRKPVTHRGLAALPFRAAACSGVTATLAGGSDILIAATAVPKGSLQRRDAGTAQ